MKKSEKEEIKNLSSKEIEERILQFKKTLFNLRCQKSMNQLTSTMQIPKIKKSIAVLKTFRRLKKETILSLGEQ